MGRGKYDFKLVGGTVIDTDEHPEWQWFRKLGLVFLYWGLPSANSNTGDAWAMIWNEQKERIGRYMEPATEIDLKTDG